MRRVRIGLQADGTYDVRASRPGFSVDANPRVDSELAFSGQWPSALRIVAQGTVSLPANTTTSANQQFAVVRVNFPALSVVPLAWAWRQVGSQWVRGDYYTYAQYTLAPTQTFGIGAFVDHVDLYYWDTVAATAKYFVAAWSA